MNGIDFNLEEARQMLGENKEEYVIELIITVPEITIIDLGERAFPHVLSSFTTRYDASNRPRTNNLELSARRVNDVVIMPGEVFSFNQIVGRRTVAAGFMEAPGFAGGRVVQMLGGGICQVTSTIYNAALYADLEIVERRPHMFITSYAGAGRDATVVYGAIDFQFRNTRNFPIILRSFASNGVNRAEIHGMREEVEHEIEITSTILNQISWRTIYTTNNHLAPGTQRTMQGGGMGANSVTYRIRRLYGVEVSRELLSRDQYDPMNRIVEVGPQLLQE